MKRFLCVFEVLAIFFLAGFAQAEDNAEILFAIKTSIMDSLMPGRVTSLQYSPSENLSLRLRNDSYDDVLYGQDLRWGLTALTPLLKGDFKLQAGAGFSLSSSSTLSDQLSFDLYVKLAYGILYLELDHLIFSDGFFGDYSLGIDWRVIHGQPDFSLCLGIGGFSSTDYQSYGFTPDFSVGLKTGF